MDQQTAAEMPKYKCHKEVWALKIREIVFEPNKTGALLYVSDPGYGPVWVEDEYIVKHAPEIGGFYVVYKDGYKSFSPAIAFEEGYTRI